MVTIKPKDIKIAFFLKKLSIVFPSLKHKEVVEKNVGSSSSSNLLYY